MPHIDSKKARYFKYTHSHQPAQRLVVSHIVVALCKASRQICLQNAVHLAANMRHFPCSMCSSKCPNHTSKPHRKSTSWCRALVMDAYGVHKVASSSRFMVAHFRNMWLPMCNLLPCFKCSSKYHTHTPKPKPHKT